MSKNKQIDLIIYLSTDWRSSSKHTEGYFFGDVPFIRALSKLPGIRILCVNQPFTPVETTIMKRAKAVNWITGNRLERLEDNLFLYTPLAPVHEMLALYSPVLQRLNSVVLSRQIRNQLKNLGFDSPIRASWIYHPLQFTYLGLLGETFKIYKCWDLFRAREYPKRIMKVTAIYEKRLIADSDLILTPCTNLYKELSLVNRNVFFTPAGVDVGEVEQTLRKVTTIPEDMVRLRRPRVGFAGIITKRVDISLIRFLAETHPNWSIVILGKCTESRDFLETEDYRACIKLSNLHFLGFKEFQELPAYFKYFDVCMLPHSNIEAMKYAHPYKTLQYLALGKPVVSTNFPDAYYYKDIIKIARSHEEFAALVGEAVNEKSEDAVKKRINFAKENTWDKRAEEAYAILRGLINRMEKTPTWATDATGTL